ncbi:MAG TPA: AMP-binding protein [Lentimicrobium sp.]|nr:AMP-binding protein [Lentimicrobium sp.]
MVSNDSQTGKDRYCYITDILRIHAESNPEKTAYIYLRDGENDEEKITFRELYNSSLNIAVKLKELGAEGERILMLFPPGMEFIKAIFGCFLAGAIAVPAYPPRKNRSLDRIKTLAVDSQTAFVISTADIYSSTERSFADLSELRKLTWIIPDVYGNGHELNNELQAHGLKVIQPYDIAFLQYTSGSTGNPKGVMVTHKNLVSNLEFLKQTFSLTKETVSVSWLPTFHDMGLIEGMMGALYNGCTGILMPPVAFIQKPVRWIKAFNKYRGTHGGAPNFAFDFLVENVTHEEREGLDLSCIDTIYCGAEPIRKTTFDRFIDTYSEYGLNSRSLCPTYGMAETTLIISGPGAQRGPVYLHVASSALEQNKIVHVPESDPDCKALVGVGHPWIDAEIRIINPDTTIPVNPDEVGEIWVYGSIVAAGYWNKHEITAETFKAVVKGEEESGKYWLRTGDLGFIYNNELFITGRMKDLIILYGKNYYPQDFEFTAEKSHPAIRPSAIAAFSIDVQNTEKLVIVCEIERTQLRNLDTEKVCNSIRNSISDEFEQQVYAIQLLRTASIPKTSSGKIQRRACKQGFLNKTLDVISESVIGETVSHIKIESSTVEAWLIIWVNQNLGVPFEKIDVMKAISDYGLNSLKAVQLQQDFLKQYRINVPPYIYFEKMSLKDLSQKAYERVNEK